MMGDMVNPSSGEVMSVANSFNFVPLNLAALDENELLAIFPSPVQLSGALLDAREKNAQIPIVMAKCRETLRVAERSLRVAEGLAVRDLRAEHGRTAALTELKNIALATDPRVISAQDDVDAAWLELEYARDREKAHRVDIDILRSLNANFRNETRA